MTVGSSKKIGVCIIVVKNKNFNTGWLYAPYDYEDGYSVDLSEQTFEPVCVPPVSYTHLTLPTNSRV